MPFDPDEAATSIRFVTKRVTPEEIAAVTAVLTAALREQALAVPASTPPAEASGWSRSARSLRQPLVGGWRGFTAEGL